MGLRKRIALAVARSSIFLKNPSVILENDLWLIRREYTLTGSLGPSGR